MRLNGLRKVWYRGFSTSITQTLEKLIPQKQLELKEFKTKFGKKSLSSYTLNQCLDGGNNIPCLFGANISHFNRESSEDEVDINFRGHSLFEIGNESDSRSPEAMLYLLICSHIPESEQLKLFQNDLSSRSTRQSSTDVNTFIHSLPSNMHVIAQLSMVLLYCQPRSKFVKAYTSGLVRKPQYWQPVLEDCLNIVSALPQMIDTIYTRKYGDNDTDTTRHVDYASRLTSLLFPSPSTVTEEELSSEFKEFIELFLVTHCDNDNLSHPVSHAIHLVNCTLSDPYKALSTGVNTLCGPRLDDLDQSLQLFRHLLWTANEEDEEEGEQIMTDHTGYLMAMDINLKSATLHRDSVETTIKSLQSDAANKGITLRAGLISEEQTDSRHTLLNEFIEKNMSHSELYMSVQKLCQFESERLTYAHNSLEVVTARPSLAVLVHIILHHYLVESSLVEDENLNVYSSFNEKSLSEQIQQTHDLYLLLFSVSCSFGGFAQIIWDRALGLSLENPKTIDMPFIEQYYREQTEMEEKK